jgi:hypothetical protein
MPKDSSPDQIRALLRRRAEILSTLPPLEEVLRGTLLERQIRCGKPNCHCAGETRHPLLVLTVSLGVGRTRQVTVPAELRPKGEAWIENFRAWWRAIEEISEINRQLLQSRQLSPAAASRRRGASRQRLRGPRA